MILRRLRRLQRVCGLLFCLLFFGVVGGNSLAAQSIAWANMIWRYSATDSLRRSVEKTFDGKHPCAICKQIGLAKSKEKEKPVLASFQKIKLRLSSPMAASTRQASEAPRPFSALRTSIQAAPVAPPSPPPEA